MTATPVEHYACAVLVRDGQVLLGLRSLHRRRAPGRWDVIGGKVEPGETRAAALARELGEELGIVPTVVRPLGTIPDPPSPGLPGAEYHLHAVLDWIGEPAIRDDEHSELRWFALADALREPLLACPDYPEFFRAAVTAARS